MQRLHHKDGDHEQHLFDLDEIARQGARRMLAAALEAEVRDYLKKRGMRPPELAVGDGALGFLERPPGGLSTDPSPAGLGS